MTSHVKCIAPGTIVYRTEEDNKIHNVSLRVWHFAYAKDVNEQHTYHKYQDLYDRCMSETDELNTEDYACIAGDINYQASTDGFSMCQTYKAAYQQMLYDVPIARVRELLNYKTQELKCYTTVFHAMEEEYLRDVDESREREDLIAQRTMLAEMQHALKYCIFIRRHPLPSCNFCDIEVLHQQFTQLTQILNATDEVFTFTDKRLAVAKKLSTLLTIRGLIEIYDYIRTEIELYKKVLRHREQKPYFPVAQEEPNRI